MCAGVCVRVYANDCGFMTISLSQKFDQFISFVWIPLAQQAKEEKKNRVHFSLYQKGVSVYASCVSGGTLHLFPPTVFFFVSKFCKIQLMFRKYNIYGRRKCKPSLSDGDFSQTEVMQQLRANCKMYPGITDK